MTTDQQSDITHVFFFYAPVQDYLDHHPGEMWNEATGMIEHEGEVVKSHPGSPHVRMPFVRSRRIGAESGQPCGPVNWRDADGIGASEVMEVIDVSDAGPRLGVDDIEDATDWDATGEWAWVAKSEKHRTRVVGGRKVTERMMFH